MPPCPISAHLVCPAVLNTRMQRRSRNVEQSLTAANVELQSRFQAVFEYAPSGFLLFNRQRGIAHCNAAAVKLFGAVDRAALVGRSPWQPPLSPPAQADGHDGDVTLLALLHRRAETGQPAQEVEWRFSRIDGTPFEARVNIVALDGDEAERSRLSSPTCRTSCARR